MAKIKIFDRELYYDTTDDNIYELRPDGTYQQTHSGGAPHVLTEFAPSSYTGNKNATTTVTGQSVAVATGATRVRVRNLDATNYGLVAFGTSASDAEGNAANGVAIEFGQTEILRVPADATYIAYLGDTGTVVLNITQGN